MPWTVLEKDGAAAVDGDDLAGDEGRAGEEVYRLRDVFRRAGARERGRGDDALPLGGRELAVLGPGDRARSDAVHPHLRRELERERARERGQAALRHAVERISLERPLGMD